MARLIPRTPVVCALLIAGAALPASAQQVGTAGAVNPAARGGTRVLELGSAIVHRERIQTTDKGSVQVLFIDRTTLNVGPNSDLVIDEFVFNPGTGTAKMGVTLGKGVMRLVGGSATKDGETRVSTPVATIGVRGGVAVVTHDARFGTKATNIFGQLRISSKKPKGCGQNQTPAADGTCPEGGGTEVVRRPHYSVSVGGPGQDPSAPVEVSQAEIDQTNRLLTSKPGQFGGAVTRPTDQTARNAGSGYQNDPIPAGNIRDNLPATITTLTTVKTVTTSASQLATVKSTVKPAAVRAPRAFALTMSADGALGANGVPYLIGGFAAAGGYKVSKVLGYANGGINADGSANQNTRTLQAGLYINGTGTGQSSSLFVSPASVVPDGAGGFVSSGVVRGSVRAGAALTAGFAASSVTSVQGSLTSDGSGVPTGYTANTNTYDAGSGTYRQNTAVAYSGAPPTAYYTFTQQAASTSVPAGLGDNRPSTPLTGYGAGLMQTSQFANAAALTGQTTGPGFAVAGGAQFQFDSNSSSVQANFNLVPLNSSGSGADAYTGGSYQFGNVANGALARSAYIDANNFGAADAVTLDAAGNDVAISTVNGRALRVSRMALVTSDTVSAQSFFPGVTFCNCDYTKWGFWSADTSRNSVNSAQTLSERTNLGTWVAGQLPSVGEIPTIGSATYTGHTVASINNNGAEYVAAGNFSNTVNFGNKTGAVSVTGLDSRSYAATVYLGGNAANAGADARTFTGTGSTTPASTAAFGAASIGFNGSFFRGSTGPVKEMGGTVFIQGTNYLGSGVFLGSR